MAGPLTIQRVPRGLLDMLVMKGSGASPTDLAPYIQGSIDLSQLFLQDTVLNDNSNTNVVNAIGAFIATGSVVPDGQLRLVTNVTAVANANNAAGESVTFQLCYLRPQSTTPHVFGEPITVGNSVRGLKGYQFSSPLIARPGTSFGLYATSVTAGAQTYLVKTEFYQLAY